MNGISWTFRFRFSLNIVAFPSPHSPTMNAGNSIEGSNRFPSECHVPHHNYPQYFNVQCSIFAQEVIRLSVFRFCSYFWLLHFAILLSAYGLTFLEEHSCCGRFPSDLHGLKAVQRSHEQEVAAVAEVVLLQRPLSILMSCSLVALINVALLFEVDL